MTIVSSQVIEFFCSRKFSKELSVGTNVNTLKRQFKRLNHRVVNNSENAWSVRTLNAEVKGAQNIFDEIFEKMRIH